MGEDDGTSEEETDGEEAEETVLAGKAMASARRSVAAAHDNARRSEGASGKGGLA